VAGKPVAGPPDGLAVVFQEYGRSLFPWLKVHDNVELPLKAKGMARRDREPLVRSAIEAVGLADARTAWPSPARWSSSRPCG
jgi:NitT/TauT family transport system ATP-binding protein